MTALQQGTDSSLDVGVGMLPARLALVHRHANLHAASTDLTGLLTRTGCGYMLYTISVHLT